MSGHTPDRWRVGDASRTIFGPNLGKPSPEIIATVAKRQNAPLLAAAPELLAALRTACDSLHENGGIWEDCTDSDLCPGCAAIANATRKAI